MKRKEHNPEEALEQWSPKLAKWKAEGKRDGFSVPPTYFRELEADVMARIQQADEASAPEGFWARLSQWWAAAPQPAFVLAGVALILTVIWMLRPDPAQQPNGESLFAQAQAAELQAYIAEHPEAFTAELVLEVADEDPAFTLSFDLTGLSEQEVDQVLDELLDELDEEALEEIL